jgi:4-hydroxy-tetrahydrodipicolinate reductase
MIRILQIGLGPLGIKTYQYIAEKQSMQTVAAVDINPDLRNKDLGEISDGNANGVLIQQEIAAVKNLSEVDAVVLTTSSSMKSIAPQLDHILDFGLPIVSTCEELTFPWKNDARLADQIDRKAKKKGVAIVSTGVNPGFMMDTLPSMLTGVCKKVDYIHVNRTQDASIRRLPFQQKIGAGLSLEDFEKKKQTGTLRHVGLTESMQFIAESVGWELDHTEDIISPVIAEADTQTSSMFIPAGHALGVRQIGRASYKGKEKIKLIFEAAVGTGKAFDEIKITGQPDINSRIEGGVHGDIATCSIVLNTIPKILTASPGLNTMRDIPIVSFIS